MARPPINPLPVDWSGENPGISLKETPDGPWSCLASYFRVVVSPHGPGHAAVIMLDPTGTTGAQNVCYTDNEALARYLIDEFVAHFGAFRDNSQLASLPLIRADRWEHAGSHASSWVERIGGPGIDVTLTWHGLGEPFFVEYDPASSATGRHEMYSLFVPATSGQVRVNGQEGRGSPIPRNMGGKEITTAFLAFSETWIAAPR